MNTEFGISPAAQVLSSAQVLAVAHAAKFEDSTLKRLRF